jgi:diguanylate cyclase
LKTLQNVTGRVLTPHSSQEVTVVPRMRSTGERLGRVTISIGVATLRKGDTAQSLIERTDTCLYAAKRHGRNRAMSEIDPEVTSSGTATAKVA